MSGLHISELVKQFLKSEKETVLPQPPYSSDLATCDFFLYSKLNMSLFSRRYKSRQAIGQTISQCLRGQTISAYLDVSEIDLVIKITYFKPRITLLKNVMLILLFESNAYKVTYKHITYQTLYTHKKILSTNKIAAKSLMKMVINSFRRYVCFFSFA